VSVVARRLESHFSVDGHSVAHVGKPQFVRTKGSFFLIFALSSSVCFSAFSVSNSDALPRTMFLRYMGLQPSWDDSMPLIRKCGNCFAAGCTLAGLNVRHSLQHSLHLEVRWELGSEHSGRPGARCSLLTSPRLCDLVYLGRDDVGACLLLRTHLWCVPDLSALRHD
jgi:hypothetical protein